MTSMGYLVTNAQNQIYLTKDENGEWIIPKDIDGNALLSINKSTGKATVGSKQYDILDGTKYLSEQGILQNSIMSGVLYLFNTKESTEGISLSNLQSDTEMEYVLDTSDDAEAQGKYDYETARIARQDNQLEMDLKQLETQHEVILKEYDTVKDVISNNVERTFNLFSSG